MVTESALEFVRRDANWCFCFVIVICGYFLGLGIGWALEVGGTWRAEPSSSSFFKILKIDIRNTGKRFSGAVTEPMGQRR